MEFFFTQRGRLAGYLAAILIALWISAARHLLRYWSVYPTLVPASVIACLAVVLGLVLMKPWAPNATLAGLWTMLIWISLDIPRLVFARTFPAWYAPIPLIGNDIRALDVVFAVDINLLVLLYHCRSALHGRDRLSG